MRQPLLALPLILTLFVSGCTSMGDFCIPGLTCTADVEETDDVIVIESLQALPTEVTDSGTINLVAIVSNVADINAEVTTVPVTIELYDYCEGLFTADEPTKPIVNLLRGEKRQVEWTLTAASSSQVPVETTCTLKIRAKYPYSTRSLTTLNLINYEEMQQRLSEGTFDQVSSYQSIGYGPIKPYLNIEDSQPISLESGKPLSIAFTMQIVNKGGGFLSSGSDGAEPSISDVSISAVSTSDTLSGGIETQLEACVDGYISQQDNDVIRLIKGESAKIPCSVSIDSVDAQSVPPIETTKTFTSAVSDYWYEFRDEIDVTVSPRF